MNEPSGQPMTLEREGPGSFESFFRQHYASVARALVIVCGDETEAQDLAQEAFARALERWDRVGGMESPVGYVYRTAFNVHRNRVRHVVRALRRRAEPPPLDNDPAFEVEVRNETRRVLAQLPAGQREALALVGWLGLDAEEAGRVLGVTAASVRGRIHRARQKIDRHLGEDDV